MRRVILIAITALLAACSTAPKSDLAELQAVSAEVREELQKSAPSGFKLIDSAKGDASSSPLKICRKGTVLACDTYERCDARGCVKYQLCYCIVI